MSPNVILTIALAFLLSGSGIFVSLILHHGIAGFINTSGVKGILCMCVGVVLLDIYRLKPSRSHTLRSLVLHYAVLRMCLCFGVYLKKQFFKAYKNGAKQQSGLLLEILKKNNSTLFARDFKLVQIQSVEEYRRHMPLTRYKDYEKYVDIIVESGSEDVMFPGKTDFFAATSGTTSGKSKLYPKTKTIKKRNTQPCFLLCAFIMWSVPENYNLKRVFTIYPVVRETFSKSGIEQGPMSLFITGKIGLDFSVIRSCQVFNEENCMYVYLVFGLCEKDITSLSIITSATALTFFKTLELNWKSICNDIEYGQLSNTLEIPPELRSNFNGRLTKNPSRARLLRAEFQKGFDGILPRIWPNCCCLFSIKTGSFQMQARLLQKKYLGGVPIATVLHMGTESIYGINFDIFKDETTYNLITMMNFFEFISEEDMDKSKPTTVLPHEVEVGQKYEMVITTHDGLYRYRTEDVVEIVGFQDNVPTYTFVRRAGDILSANLEKVPEVLVYDSVMAAADRWKNKSVFEFTSVENSWVENITGDVSGTSFYIVFIEMGEGDKIDVEEMNQVDDELRSRHVVYSAMRANGKLKAVQMIQVKTGTFETVKSFLLGSNPNANFLQYKSPRITHREDILQILLKQSIQQT